MAKPQAVQQRAARRSGRGLGFGLGLGLGMLSLVLAALAPASAAPPAPPFSRSRWIADLAARGTRFSGGVLPADREALLAALAAPVPPPPAAPGAKAGNNRPVRVSGDVLPPDGSGAQPETQAEPFLAADPERPERLLAGYQEGRFVDGGARALTWAVSDTSGRRWTEGLVPGLTLITGGGYERASDPWVAFGPGGRAYFAALAFDQTTPRNGVFVSASDDGGRTWGAPVAVHLGGPGEFDDKEAIVVDTRADSPYRGRVYTGWDTVDSTGQETLRVAWSDDGGLSFGAPVTIERAASALGIVPLVGPGGAVHAVWLHAEGQDLAILAARSDDGGASWSAPVRVASWGSAGVPDLRTGQLPAAAVDPVTGHLAAAWQDSRFTPGIDQVLLVLSADGGASWSAPRRVSEGPADAPAFTPAVAFDGRGSLAVAYYTLRHDPARRFLVDEYLALSRNRGARFRRALRLSPRSWDVREAAYSTGFFLGDYQGLAAGKRLFHALWIATLDRSHVDPPARQPDAFARAVRP